MMLFIDDMFLLKAIWETQLQTMKKITIHKYKIILVTEIYQLNINIHE
jgi:hypothetical protein